MQPDRVYTHVLYRDTKYRIERLRLAVKEGRRLDEAADFAKFVINSVAPLLISLPQGDPLPCDGHLLRGFASDLLSSVQDHWRAGKASPSVELSAVEGVSRKLDLIAGRLAQMSVPNMQTPVKCPNCGHLHPELAEVIELQQAAGTDLVPRSGTGSATA